MSNKLIQISVEPEFKEVLDELVSAKKHKNIQTYTRYLWHRELEKHNESKKENK